jgi:hypothetical protein
MGAYAKGTAEDRLNATGERYGCILRPAFSYRFFVRRLFMCVGSAEKVAEVRSAGSIGAAFTVVLTLTFPEGVNVVFVRMRMVVPSGVG